MTIKRVDSRTTTSEYKSDDGHVVDQAQTSVSADGKTES